jgi:hypothetical protein
MSETIFIDIFNTDIGDFRSTFDHQGCRLEFNGGLESRSIGIYANRQDAVDIIGSQKTGVQNWDMLPPHVAREQLKEVRRWKTEPFEIFSDSEKPIPRRFSADELLPRTTPPRNQT